MEVAFDNKTNVLAAKLRTTIDHSAIYSITTDESLWRRSYTYLRDTCPVLGGEPTIVGVINWRRKTFEINGVRKKVDDIRRKPKGFGNKSRFWKWADDREEYEVVHFEDGGWQALCTSSDIVEATFSVPYRTHLFKKTKPLVMNLTREALARDEIFLILALIYCETKRQEKMNLAGGW